MTVEWTVTIDCAHPGRLAELSAPALGNVESPPPEGFDTWEERRARVTEAVERLTAAGASVSGEVAQDGPPDHVVMTDPEGNEFCVV